MSPQHRFQVIRGLQIESSGEYWSDSIAMHQINLKRQLIGTLDFHCFMADQRDSREIDPGFGLTVPSLLVQLTVNGDFIYNMFYFDQSVK